MGSNVGVGAVDKAVDRNAPTKHVPTFRRRGLWLCEPENANATPEIATAVTGGAVSGVAFVFSGGRKRKCNDGRPGGEFFLLCP